MSKIRKTMLYAIFSFLPAILMFGAIECLLRAHLFEFYYKDIRKLNPKTNAFAVRALFPKPDLNPVHPSEQKRYAFRPDTSLIWSLKPNFYYQGKLLLNPNPTLQTNSLGFRGDFINPYKPDGVRRIACLGDSVTFGYGETIGESDTYPRKLESLLNLFYPHLEFEVINAGCTGYSSRQGRILLEERVLPLKPDLVILGFGNNDRIPIQVPEEKQMKRYRGWRGDKLIMLNSLESYKLLKWSINKLRGKRGLLHPIRESPRVSISDYISLTKQMIELCRANGAKVLLLNLIFEPEYHQRLNQALKKLHESSGVLYLDIRSLFANDLESIRQLAPYQGAVAYRELELGERLHHHPWLYLMDDVVHPNCIGQARIADHIFALMVKEEYFKDLLKPPTPHPSRKFLLKMNQAEPSLFSVD